jgi:hypothetical protein
MRKGKNHRRVMMKTALWAAAAILILLGTAVYAKDAPSADMAPDDGYIFPINSKSAESLYERKEKRLEGRRAGKRSASRLLNHPIYRRRTLSSAAHSRL